MSDMKRYFIRPFRTLLTGTAIDNQGQELAVHGWIYRIGDGLLRDLDICITNQRQLSAAYEDVVRASG